MSSFKTTGLFGGAIAVDLPTNFGDVSSIRDVPDNQEVYLDKDGFTSIIFDITERVSTETASTDEAALKYHFEDIIDANEKTKFYQHAHAALTKMPSIPAFTLVATQHPSPNAPPQKKPEPDFTGILLTLVRLEQQETDIVITINVPHSAGEYAKEDVDLVTGKTGPLFEKALEMRTKILETFEVRNWGLFVN